MARIVGAWILSYMLTHAASFTFDFRYPTGQGSPYDDAISLNTVNAVRDRNGKPIGFTKANHGADSHDRVACMTLTANGLAFDTTQGNAMLGVPFNTAGEGQNNGGTIRIRAFLESIREMDKSWEQISVGWGFDHTVAAWTNFSGARIMADPGIRYTVISVPSSRHETGSIPDQTITVRKWQNDPVRFYGVFDTGGTSINDHYGLLNTASGVYGLFGVHNTAIGDGFSGLLVAIQFTGENLVVPEIQLPRGTLFIIR